MSSDEPLSEAGALPVHVGIIMDGNGRWAQARGRARTYGHREGLKAAKRVVTRAAELGLSHLSLYTFSTENWNRAREEVSFLMVLIRTHLRKELAFYRDLGIRVIHSGDRTGLPEEVLDALELVTTETAHFQGLTLNLAINYGGRDEIVRADAAAADPGERLVRVARPARVGEVQRDLVEVEIERRDLE